MIEIKALNSENELLHELPQHLHQYCLLKGELLQIFMWPLNSKIMKTQHCVMMKQANVATKQVLFRLLLQTRPMQWVYLTKIQAHRKGYLILSKNAKKKPLTILVRLQNLMNFQNCC